MLAAACSGTQDDIDAFEIGELEQAYSAECTNFGVDLDTNPNLPKQCNIQSGKNCHYTKMESNQGVLSVVPPAMVLGSSWSTSERSAVEAWGDTAASNFTAQFGNQWNAPNTFPWRFYKSTNDTTPEGLEYSGNYATVNRGAVSGGSISGPLAQFERIVSVVCDSSASMVEGYSGTARRCNHWVATIDADKIAGVCSASTCAYAYRNIFRKLYIIMASTGLTPGGTTSDVQHDRVHFTQEQNLFTGSNVSDISNLRLMMTGGSNTFGCY